MATLPRKRGHQHLLDTFHEREQAPTKAPVQSTPIEPGAGLVPVPQPAPRRVKRQQVASRAGLPSYLQHPKLVPPSLSVPFADLALTPRLQENLAKHGFTDAFAVQAALLPVLLERHLPEDRQDVLVSAPTGSGKTISYALPILQVLHTRRITALRALIIVPTRELVQQVQETLELLNTKVGLKIESLSSARTLRAEQTLLVRDGSRVDILVCTPGRLVDHLQATPGFTLQHLRFLVIDEGDRLLNQSFHDWANKIEAALPRPSMSLLPGSMERCQKLIFSATMNGDPGLLAQLRLTRPVLYNVREDAEKFSLPATLKEYFVNAPSDVPKPLVLLHVLKRLDIEKAIVFTNSTESAQRLAKLIAPFISCQAFTSIQTSSARQGLLKQFNDGTVQVLVASDLISRGLDTSTPVVINYASSILARQYVHRVGRTARAGNKGLAISIVEPEEAKFWWSQIGSGGKISRGELAVQRVTLFKKREGDLVDTVDLLPIDELALGTQYEAVLKTLQE